MKVKAKHLKSGMVVVYSDDVRKTVSYVMEFPNVMLIYYLEDDSHTFAEKNLEYTVEDQMILPILLTVSMSLFPLGPDTTVCYMDSTYPGIWLSDYSDDGFCDFGE